MPRESKVKRKERLAAIVRILKKRYGLVQTSLHNANPLQLLVGTILSAQCTDVRVNLVTPALFRKYTTARQFADTPQAVLQEEIRSTGFYRNKAKNIRGACERIADHFDGSVPETMAELLSLPGVARKSASCVLGAAFGKAEGIVVDTHVIRLSGRLGFTEYQSNQGDRIEKDLMELVAKRDWIIFSNLLIAHGRDACRARKPNCRSCDINKLCPSSGKV